MIQPYILLDKVSDAFGDFEFTQPMTMKDPNSARALGVTEAQNCPEVGLSSWATISASEFPTGYTSKRGMQIRVEFVAAVDERWRFMGSSIAACALQIGPPNAVGPGTVYRDAIGRHFNAATTPHLLSVVPFSWDKIEPHIVDDVHVTWLQLVPVSEAEADFCLTRGYDELDELFDRTQPDLYSIERASVV